MDRGDRFSELYQAQYETVLRYALRRTDPETARDAVAETFLVAWRRLDTVPADHAQATPWLYGVARNVLALALGRYGLASARAVQRNVRGPADLPGRRCPDLHRQAAGHVGDVSERQVEECQSGRVALGHAGRNLITLATDKRYAGDAVAQRIGAGRIPTGHEPEPAWLRCADLRSAAIPDGKDYPGDIAQPAVGQPLARPPQAVAGVDEPDRARLDASCLPVRTEFTAGDAVIAVRAAFQ